MVFVGGENVNGATLADKVLFHAVAKRHGLLDVLPASGNGPKSKVVEHNPELKV